MESAPKRKTNRKKRTRYVWLNVLPDDLWAHVPQGITILEALQEAGVEVAGDCGGLGNCGKCRIKVLSEVGEPSQEEDSLLDKEELDQGIRLACRTRIDSDMVISVAEADTEPEYFKILTTSHVLTSRYIPRSQLEPLIQKHPVVLPEGIQDHGRSDLDSIKLQLGPEYHDLSAPLDCLKKLPQRLKETRFRGTAVLHDNCLIDWQKYEMAGTGYGLVFDLGTSTLVGKLFNLSDGSEVAVTSCLNSQQRYGADVISRLRYCQEHHGGVITLHRVILSDLNRIASDLLRTAGLEPEDVHVAVAAGNTTMQHFTLGISPLGIAEAPFSPILTDGFIVSAREIGLQLHPLALFYTMPVKSGYIGGDMLGVILTSGVAEQEDEIILGLDLGTNGELFLGNGKRLLTCSAAAGPALEGARISHGMIAKGGAIEGVSMEDGMIRYRIIGNTRPEGICGSGLVDLIAVLLNCGIIDKEGLIRPVEPGAAGNLSSRVVKRAGVYDFLIASAEESAHHRPIYLRQKDVREFQLAKAAIAAGIKIMMDEIGIGVPGIQHVYMAGALGNYIDPASAIRTGIIPGVATGIIRSLGNAASTGASMALLSKRHWRTAAELAEFVENVELSNRSDFNRYFVEQMDFPEDGL